MDLSNWNQLLNLNQLSNLNLNQLSNLNWWQATVMGCLVMICLMYLVTYVNHEMNVNTIPVSWANTKTNTNVDLQGSCAVRMGEEREYLFLGGGYNQNDVILGYDPEKKRMVPLVQIKKAMNNPTTCAASAIMTPKSSNLYLEDIVVGRFDGVYLLTQTKPGIFETRKIHTSQPNELPSSVSLGDYNNSGSLSIFIGNYAAPGFVDPMTFGTGKTVQNYLLRNDGLDDSRIKFTDVTKEMGIQGNLNTWTAAFIDLDGKGYPDIVVANDEGEIDIYRNDGESFHKIKLPGTYIGYWMGIASGDYNNTGKQSLFFSNVGVHTEGFSSVALKLINKVPSFPKGYTVKHLLLENLGNYQFKAHLVGDSKMFIGGEGQFGWGCMFADLNLNGHLDLMYSTGWKYIPWNVSYLTRDSSVVWLNQADHKDNANNANNASGKTRKFVKTKQFSNKFFSQTPLAIDLTNNGNQELIWVNHFTSSKIYQLDTRGEGPNKAHRVSLPKTAKYANSTTVLTTPNGVQQTRQLILGGTGLGSGESGIFSFGIGSIINRKEIKVATYKGIKKIQ